MLDGSTNSTYHFSLPIFFLQIKMQLVKSGTSASANKFMEPCNILLGKLNC